MTSAVETHEFQAEARQLLELMIHSVYSEKDIFLRELISNASDALDKLRLESLVNQDLSVDTQDLRIQLVPDTEQRTLEIIDNGIGMSRDEVISLIGTIAKSGTRDFVKLMAEKPNQADLIGQFGVGFYSAFMVADKVVLETRKATEAQGVRWESSGDGSYTVEAIEREEWGTSIRLHLKPADPENGLHDYTQTYTLRDIVKRYSDFISYPIVTEVVKPAQADEIPQRETETLNSMKALWTRPKEEVGQDEYNQFYHHLSHDWTDPWEVLTMRGEGTFEYHALLFVPTRAPFDLFMPEGRQGLHLYVRKVFIMDDCEQLMPPYLRFVRGVVDATDLPLNISREILQKDRHIEQIRKRLVKKLLDTFGEVKSTDLERYKAFWKEFGRVLKEGIYNDPKNREALLELALFRSTHSDELTDLTQVMDRLGDRDTIYYLTGENLAALQQSPHLEKFRQMNVEVLLLTDPVDEIWLSTTPEFKSKKLVSAARGELKLGDEAEQKAAEDSLQEQAKEFAAFLSWLGSKLDKVKESRLSNRLTESPCCLVGDAHDLSSHLEKLMRSMGQEVPEIKRNLEVNPNHPLVAAMKKAYDEKSDHAELEAMAQVLYGLAVLSEGGELDNPAEFSRHLGQVLVRAV